MFWVSEQIHLSQMLWGMKTKKVAEELRGAELEGRQKVCFDQRRNNLNFFINLIVFSPRPHGKTLTNCKSFSSASCLGSKSARINHSQILKEKLHKLQKIIKTSFWVQVLFVWTVLLFFHVWLGWSDWATNQLGTIASSLITPHWTLSPLSWNNFSPSFSILPFVKHKSIGPPSQLNIARGTTDSGYRLWVELSKGSCYYGHEWFWDGILMEDVEMVWFFGISGDVKVVWFQPSYLPI